MPPTGPASRRQVAVSTALAALLACLVLLPLLGHRPLAEWDEGIYAEVSREMLGGSWLVPHWNGQPWFEKPPLPLWITALFFKLFGVSEFWARAASAFSGVAIVALLHRWLARRRDLLAAWLGTVILLATLGFLHVCRVGEMDVLLSLGACVALIGLAEVDDGRTAGWYLFWSGFALAVMTKGAASVVIPIAATIFVLVQHWKRPRFGRAFAAGAGLFLLLTLPWHLLMLHRFGGAFVDEYLGLHVLARATRQIEGHKWPWWFYVRVLAVSAPPFALLYPVAAYRGLRRAELRVWAIFAGVVLLFFTAIQTRLPHYVAPAYPALSLLVAVYVAEWLQLRYGASLRSLRLAWGFSPTNSGPERKRALAPAWVLLLTAAVWAGSIAATHSSLKRLHSAGLDGEALLDNKEADALLREAMRRPIPVDGPLLLWRDGQVESVATVIFYARRPVQQIQLAPDTVPRNRYRHEPVLFSDAVGASPRLLLLDKTLLPSLPARFAFHPLQVSRHMELGTIAPRP